MCAKLELGIVGCPFLLNPQENTEDWLVLPFWFINSDLPSNRIYICLNKEFSKRLLSLKNQSTTMKSTITKSFDNSHEEFELKRTVIEKKSRWVKAWRSRQIVLFSNKLTFAPNEKTKPRISNVVYLGEIISINSDPKLPMLLKIGIPTQMFEIKFKSVGEKESWISDIIEACRTYKINKSQSSNFQRCSTSKMQEEPVFCCGLECF